MGIVNIHNLRKSFADVTAVSGISLEVQAGEVHGILGPNGAGKSTTINCMLGLLGFDNGTVTFENEQSVSKWKKNIGYIPQDLAVYPDLTAEENVSFFCSLYGFKGTERKKKVDDALDFVGLLEVKRKKASEFSGGMKRRLNMACGIVHSPKLIIMDEPTVGIDPQSRNRILENVKALNEKGATIIYTTHYMPEVEAICNKITVIDHGKVVITGTKVEIIEKMGRDKEIDIDFAVNVGNFEAFEAAIRKMGDTPVLRVDKLHFKRGKDIIFNDFSADFYRGQITAITGRNGVGKTTLCKIVTGELKQRKGAVYFFGENTPAKKRIQDCFFVGQDADYQIFTPTVLQEVTLNTDYSEDSEDVKEILESFDLWKCRKRHPASLSGGQKQRVLLAAALIRKDPFLILDEPTSGLDGRNMRIIGAYLKRAAANGICILVITHDKEFINVAADEVLIIER